MTLHRYTRTAIALHWWLAILVAVAVAIGLYAVELETSPQKLRLYAWHKWVGIAVLAFAIVRLAWRLRHAPPAPLPSHPLWMRTVAAGTQALLHALLIAVPLTGWLMSSASGFPVVLFGVLPLPDLITEDKALADSLKLGHFILNKSLLGLIGLHVAAALKHHFIDRDITFMRMLPPLSSKEQGK